MVICGVGRGSDCLKQGEGNWNKLFLQDDASLNLVLRLEISNQFE